MLHDGFKIFIDKRKTLTSLRNNLRKWPGVLSYPRVPSRITRSTAAAYDRSNTHAVRRRETNNIIAPLHNRVETPGRV